MMALFGGEVTRQQQLEEELRQAKLAIVALSAPRDSLGIRYDGTEHTKGYAAGLEAAAKCAEGWHDGRDWQLPHVAKAIRALGKEGP
jgi:hypothetical protein